MKVYWINVANLGVYIIFVGPEVHWLKQENSEVILRSEGNQIKDLKHSGDQQLSGK